MRVTKGLEQYRRGPYPVVTIGNFDGQHLGHRTLLQRVVETAAAREGTPIVLTFEPHPAVVLSHQRDLRFLTDREQQLICFERAGIAEVLFIEFTLAFASLGPEAFVTSILRDGVGARELFVGEHFAFGKGRSGRIGDLVRLGSQAGMQVHPVQPVMVDGAVASSTRIRMLIQTGDVRAAARCLGRPYSLSGAVERGFQRGQTLGWPTANMALPAGRVIPADGVYATLALWRQRRYASVSYIGTSPTFGPGERKLEVYLLDEVVDLYGEFLSVQFVERLRDDRTFAAEADLAACIEGDVARARELLQDAALSGVEAYR